MRRRRNRIICATTIAGLLVLGATSATASTTANPLLVEDAATISAQSQSVTAADLEKQAVFNTFADDVRQRYPSVFVDAVYDKTVSTITVSGRTPAALEEDAATLGIPVEINSGAGVPETKMLELQQTARAELSQQGKLENSLVYFDAVNGDLMVSHTATTGTESNGDLADVVSEAVLTDPAADGEDVSVSVTPDAVAASEVESFGGGHLTSCTAAFGGKHKDGRRGLIGAWHCPANTTFEGGKRLTTIGGIPKANGDGRFYASPDSTPTAKFRHNKFKSMRTVSGTTTASKGTNVCKYGMATNETCGTIHYLKVCSGDYCNLSGVERHISSEGDSGGPWFIGSKAVGIHHGAKKIGLLNRSLFTPIGAMISTGGGGVTVMTG